MAIKIADINVGELYINHLTGYLMLCISKRFKHVDAGMISEHRWVVVWVMSDNPETSYVHRSLYKIDAELLLKQCNHQ